MLTRSMASAALACMLLCAEAQADTALTDLQANASAAKTNAVKDGWQGSMALGYLQTTGNSDTTTLNAKALIGYKGGDWQDAFLFQTLKASSAGVLTAESTELNAQADYNLSSLNYLFGNFDFLHDTFSGYQHRTSEVVGYGHRLLATDSQQLDVELGAGARQTAYTDGSSDSEPVELLSGSYLYKFTKTSNFSENLTFIHGSSNAYSQSVSALTVNLAGSFALSVSYTVSHNSTVLPGFKNTDTITAISLVYSFAPPDAPKAVDVAAPPP